jgi:hypothetical protein
MGRDRFGIVEEKVKPTAMSKGNRREKEIKSIRVELRKLKRAYRNASAHEKEGLEELRHVMRERLKSLRRAENSRQKGRDRARKRAQFISNPFEFLKKLLGDKRSGRLQCPREEVEKHLRETHNDPRRDEALEYCAGLLQPEEPTVAFDLAEPRWKEVEEVIRKARAASAPGPNGIPYRVYKNCQKVARRLWRLLKVAWKKNRMTESWVIADGWFIPKEENSNSLKQFRTISLLNVEGKIFLAVLAKRMTSYMLANNYIDVAVQKGGIPGVSGCLEHTAALTQIIREARENGGYLAVLWLDLANAYGSIPHKLVQLTLQRYHIPEKIQDLLKDYFDRMKMRFTVGNYTTAWQRLEVGIVTGCTISVILFAAAMNLLAKSAERVSRGPVMASGRKQPPTRAFMDDMTVTAKTVVEGRWMLEDLERIITWARMSFKPAKSRSLVLKKGKVQDRVKFRVGGQVIPTISEQPVKSLGKWFTKDLKDKGSCEEMVTMAIGSMEKVEKSGLPGKFKAWCYQHGVLPRILWPLLIYEIPLTTVEKLEKKISSYLRRWLGVPRSFSSVGLYSTSSKMQLPIKALTEEYKATKAGAVMTIHNSRDQKIRDAGIEIRTGSKWKAETAVKEAEARLRHQDIVGTVAQGRLGLGCVTRSSWRAASTTERRDLVLKDIREQEEESRRTRAVAMQKQGRWLHWEGVRSRQLNWRDLWRMEGHRVRFLLRAVYDVLPSPTNLFTWGLAQDPSCKLCQKPANLEHVLSSCRVALSEGRYTWRHNQVLKVITNCIDKARRQKPHLQKKIQFIKFLKAGEKRSGATSLQVGILASASDWLLAADVGDQLKFPQEVAITNSRPDIVLWSRNSRQVIILELTVPWEERIEEANERKRIKYQQLVQDCRENGWKTWCLPIEVGCRGFAGQSLWSALRQLGITGIDRKKAIGEACEEAEKASRWVWIKRDESWRS